MFVRLFSHAIVLNMERGWVTLGFLLENGLRLLDSYSGSRFRLEQSGLEVHISSRNQLWVLDTLLWRKCIAVSMPEIENQSLPLIAIILDQVKSV